MRTFDQLWTDEGPVAQEVFTASFPGFYVFQVSSTHSAFLGLEHQNPGIIDLDPSGRKTAVVYLDAEDVVYLWSGADAAHGGYDYTIDVRGARFAVDELSDE